MLQCIFLLHNKLFGSLADQWFTTAMQRSLQLGRVLTLCFTGFLALICLHSLLNILLRAWCSLASALWVPVQHHIA